MSGVLDEYPLDFSRPELQAIRDVLARTIYRTADIEDIILASGLNPGMIVFSDSASLLWRRVLERAGAELRMGSLLDVVRKREPLVGRRLDELAGPRPVLEPGTGAADDLTDPAGPGWRGFGNERLVVERANTLLGISFLGTGLARSRSICRVKVAFGPAKEGYGTGALIGPGLLLTNHHVLHDWDDGGRPATAAEAWFGYETSEEGLTRPDLTVVGCDPATITGDRAQDWAVARVSDPDAPRLAGTPVLALRGAAPARVNDYVFIIQHPDGGPKMIGLSHNLVRHVDENVVQYWTDTKTGSSGAPVFNSRWQVVALHHRWVDAPKGDGAAYRNQGRRIDRVIEGLQAHGLAVS